MSSFDIPHRNLLSLVERLLLCRQVASYKDEFPREPSQSQISRDAASSNPPKPTVSGALFLTAFYGTMRPVLDRCAQG